jgi:hypothetical protein
MAAPATSHLKTLVRVLVLAAFVGIAVWFATTHDLHAIATALRHADLKLLLLATAINYLVVLFRAACIREILRPTKLLGLGRLFRYHLACFAASNLLPARAGDVLRVYLLQKREDIPWKVGLSMSVVEKGTEALAMVLMLLPIPWVVPGLPPSVVTALRVMGWVTLGVLVALGAVALTGRGKAFLSRFGTPSSIARAEVFSLGAWVSDAVIIYLVLHAVGVAASPAAPLLVLFGVNLAVALPSTPGQVGVLEAGAVGALAIVGVPPEPAMAFAILYHLVQFLPVTLAGLPGLSLVAEARQAAAAAQAPEGVA